MINQEARLLWQGNSKIHIKGNSNTRLKMEELVTCMEPMCSIPEIGFGRGEKQWARTSLKSFCPLKEDYNFEDSTLL